MNHQKKKLEINKKLNRVILIPHSASMKIKFNKNLSNTFRSLKIKNNKILNISIICSKSTIITKIKEILNKHRLITVAK